jgi:hypothetical protein
LGFILKISASPVGLFTPLPVVRALTKTIVSGEAASARWASPASATMAARAAARSMVSSTALLALLPIRISRVVAWVVTSEFLPLDPSVMVFVAMAFVRSSPLLSL